MGLNQTDVRILLSFACDLMAVDTPKLSFKPLSEEDSNVAGKYYPGQHTLFINLAYGDRALQIFTLFHEARHHYQYVVVENNDTQLETEETIRKWSHDIQHYVPSAVDRDKHDRLSIEVDADAFACIMVLYIWGVCLSLDERKNQEEIAMRIQEIANEYTFEEAKQVAIEHQATYLKWTS